MKLQKLSLRQLSQLQNLSMQAAIAPVSLQSNRSIKWNQVHQQGELSQAYYNGQRLTNLNKFRFQPVPQPQQVPEINDQRFPNISKQALPLNHAALPYLRLDIQTPSYDRSKCGTGWCHIGLGNFHRAHQAVYADDLLEKNGPSEWGICGIGLLPGDSLVNNILKKQDHYYTVIERSPTQDKARIVGSVQDFIFAVENPEIAIEKMASEQTKIVSMTITEKGYHTNDFGDLDFTDKEVKHDLENPTNPMGTYGYLTSALRRRMDRGILPFTIMSCDNVSHNGDIIKKALLQFVQKADKELYEWLATKGTFPNTMVDRITPAFSKATQSFTKDSFQIEDGWPISTEFFRQWVIEDKFVMGRPEFEDVGVQVVKDVYPYEKLKLHMLNLSHSAVAYYGVLQGYQYVHEAVQDPLLKKLLNQIMDNEVQPSLLPVPGVDTEDYKKAILQRFSNQSISDTLLRITMDGVGKIPKFVVPPLLEALEEGRECRGLVFVIASWFRFLQGVNEDGNEYTINDPYAEQLQRLAKLGGKDPCCLMNFKTAFGENLTKNVEYKKQLKSVLYDFYEIGSLETLEKVLKQTGQLSEVTNNQA